MKALLINGIAQATVTPYGPGDLGADLAAGSGEILGWVGAAVGAGVVVMLGLLGIRRGLGTFRGVAR